MKRFLLLFLLSLTGCHTAQQITISDLTGDWISNELVESIKKNKTLINAKSAGYSSFEIKKEGNIYAFLMSFEKFHEGYVSYVHDIEKEGENIYKVKYEVRKYENSDYYSPKFVETLPDKKQIYFHYIDWEKSNDLDKNPVVTKNLYIKAEPDLKKYINILLLKGEYVDGNNNTYRFTEDFAEFPNAKFQYTVNTDTALLTVYDSFSSSSFTQDFEWKNDTLLIYKPRPRREDTDMYGRKDEPQYILKKKK